MSIVVNPFPILNTGLAFPLDVPDQDHNWEIIKTFFYQPDWDNAAGTDVEFVINKWVDIQFFGINDTIFDNLAQLITDKFVELGQGGTPLAFRIYRAQEFQVSVPQTICVPEWGILGGIFGGDGCFDVPVIGGSTLVTAYVYAMELIYTGSPLAITLTGSLTLILAIIGIIVAVYLIGTGTIHLDPGTKQIIDHLTPGGTAGSITTALLVGGAVIGLLLVLAPGLGKGLEATGRYLPLPQTPRPATLNLPSPGGAGISSAAPRTASRRSRR